MNKRVILLILDGWGQGTKYPGNAIELANTPNFDNLIKYQLEPELYSFNILKAFSQYLQQHNIKNYPVHIKLDTGMHRLGFIDKELDLLSDFLFNNKTLIVKSVFSHLVASENVIHDDFTEQ